MRSVKDLYEILAELGVEYVKHEHPAVYTCEEADEHCGNIPGGRSKNLLLRDKKGKKHYLVVVESDKMVNLKALAEVLGESKLSFASEERLVRVLGLKPGAVSPFGLIHEGAREVVVVLDKDLLQHERLSYHPGVNTATLELAQEDLMKFLEAMGNELNIVEL